MAESFEPNADATRVDVQDQGRPEVLERRADPAELRSRRRGSGLEPDFAGDYSYLFSFIEGGQAKLDGEATSLSGVTADDSA